jgi:uncharacterized protein with PQ loop repeat
MFDILKNCVEYQNFGFNTLTISALATIFFSFFQGYGAIAQSKKIWHEESGETITVLFFVSNFWYFMSFFIYGIYQDSIAITLNGAVGFLYIPILMGLKKFKGFAISETIFSLLGFLVIPAMILVGQKNIVLTAMILMVAPFTIIQFYEFIKSRSLGAFSIKYVIIFFTTSAFWLIYSIAILKWPLIILNGATTTIYLVVIFLNHKFKKRKGVKNEKR